MSVPDQIRELCMIYTERNLLYGDDYKRHGLIMQELFPDGLQLSSLNDYNRYSCLKEIVTKITRYAKNFHSGGHDDSLDDISVYAQMLKELDHDCKK